MLTKRPSAMQAGELQLEQLDKLIRPKLEILSHERKVLSTKNTDQFCITEEMRSFMQDAQSMNGRINVNKNVMNLYPQKAINLLMEVQEKRKKMNEELLNLGVGQKFTD